MTHSIVYNIEVRQTLSIDTMEYINGVRFDKIIYDNNVPKDLEVNYGQRKFNSQEFNQGVCSFQNRPLQNFRAANDFLLKSHLLNNIIIPKTRWDYSFLFGIRQKGKNRGKKNNMLQLSLQSSQIFDRLSFLLAQLSVLVKLKSTIQLLSESQRSNNCEQSNLRKYSSPPRWYSSQKNKPNNHRHRLYVRRT